MSFRTLPRLALLFCFLSLLPPLACRAAGHEEGGDLPSAPLPSAVGLSSDPDAESVTEQHRGQISIPRLDAEPKISEFQPNAVSGAARRMVRISRFVQRYPEDGAVPAQKTVAYLGYTHDALFVGFVCHDSNPELVRAHMLARDAPGDDDSVQVMLDTFHDQRRAFVFQTNPLGVQTDALYSEQTGFDNSFDTVWDSWGEKMPNGYAVLMRIPFASLYFAKANTGDPRTWGIILSRNIAHTDESDFWPRINHAVAGRLTQDMEIQGFRDVEHGKNLQFQPYLLARSLRQLNSIDGSNPFFENKHLQGYGGLDAKFILHNSLVLDTTINPDFSQVGVDNPAVPNQRFPPYFAEVRPFFIENSSFFQTPISLYYTNNIVKPQYGARLTGKLGPWAVGMLDVDDRGPGEGVPDFDPEHGKRAHIYLGRINRDLGSFSNVGLIYSDREYLDSSNRAGGIDYRVRLKDRWTITGQGLTSQTRNLSNDTQGEQTCETYALSCSGQAWLQELSYSDLHWSLWSAYSDTSAGFVTDTGYFQRPDIRQPNGHLGYTYRPKQGPVLSHGPSVYAERIWDHTGLPLDAFVHAGYHVELKRRTSLSGYYEQGQDRLRPVDYGALTANVEYQSHTTGMEFYTSPVSFIALGGSYYQGATINFNPPDTQGPGPVNVASPTLNLDVKPISAVDLQNSYVYSHFTNPSTGELVYDNHELISRWNYQMTRAASFNVIGQYISTLPHPNLTALTNSQSIFADALFTYMPHPGTALYVGYIGNFANLDRALCTREASGTCNPANPILPTTTGTLMNDGKTIYVKLSYLLRF